MAKIPFKMIKEQTVYLKTCNLDNKELVCTTEDLLQIVKIKTNDPIFLMAKRIEQTFHKRSNTDSQKACEKKSSTSLVIRKMQLKSQ